LMSGFANTVIGITNKSSKRLFVRTGLNLQLFLSIFNGLN